MDASLTDVNVHELNHYCVDHLDVLHSPTCSKRALAAQQHISNMHACIRIRMGLHVYAHVNVERSINAYDWLHVNFSVYQKTVTSTRCPLAIQEVSQVAHMDRILKII